MRPALLAILVGTLSGCASAPSVDYSTISPEVIATQATVIRSKFDRGVRIEGPVIRNTVAKDSDSLISHIDIQQILLRAFKADRTRHQVYVVINYVGSRWRFYRNASFPGGNVVPITVIDRRVNLCGPSCDYTEEIGIELTEDQLRGSNDLEFRLNAQSGRTDVITVPRNYIDGYLLAVTR